MRHAMLPALFLVACGSGCSRPAPAPNPPEARTSPVTVSTTTSTSTTSTGSTTVPTGVQGVLRCEPQDGRRVEIISGSITCAEAYATFAAYDLQGGPKYQHIGGFTCYSGNAMTFPQILTCVSDRAQFGVFEPATG